MGPDETRLGQGLQAQQFLRPGKNVRGHAEGVLEGDVAVSGILN